ncbi:MAG: pyridoxamine 5'-phosphate oxidase family protein [Candidatus Diapherotrites archaeon]|nr:pyridoxamine 5'-phosphate oxidase family protein [Candidatus Diapherotrites archaeon]
MKIPEEAKKLFDGQDIVAFGTADANGVPNVCAVFWKKVTGDDTILILDNFFKQTKQNLAENNKVCISFWNSSTEEGYKLKGTATYYTEGPVFEQGKAWMQSKKPDRTPRGVVEVKIDQVFSITPGEHAGELL